MKIDLREIPTYWATIEKNTERHEKMESMFKDLTMMDTHQINGEIADPYTVGIAQSHIDGLSNDLPLLMMEDDAKDTEHWEPVIEVPEHCDALYLGTSWFGMVRGESQYKGCISSVYDDKYLKVYNMLGVHAVLYLTKEYRDFVVELLEGFKKNPEGGCDECVAANMKSFDVLAVKEPFFYQNDGHSEDETLRPQYPYF